MNLTQSDSLLNRTISGRVASEKSCGERQIIQSGFVVTKLVQKRLTERIVALQQRLRRLSPENMAGRLTRKEEHVQ
jgi:hypothetical protein